MVRIRRAAGGWEDLDPDKQARKPFERSDGTVMSEQEIANVAKADGDFVKHNPAEHKKAARKPRGISPGQQEAWDLYQQWRSTERVGKELGITGPGVISRLDGYARNVGMDLEKAPWRRHKAERPEPPTLERQGNGRHKFAGVYEPLEEAAHRDAQDVPVNQPVTSGPPAIRHIDEPTYPIYTRVVEGHPLTEKQGRTVLEGIGAGEYLDVLRQQGFDLIVIALPEQSAA